MTRLLLISRFFNIDRMLLYSSFLESLPAGVTPLVWSGSVNEPEFPRQHVNGRYFAPLDTSISLPYWLTLPRHFDNYLWDAKGYSFSRRNFWQLRTRHAASRIDRILSRLAGWTARFIPEQRFEAGLAALIHRYGATAQATAGIQAAHPDLVVSMLPFDPIHMAYISAARRLRVPVLAFIPSWDNLSTKNRMILPYDAYIVWSESMRDELHYFYPQSRDKPVYITGAPQYDVFAQPQYTQTRADFFAQYGLDPARPLISYCLGSPNLIREDYGALEFVRRAQSSPELAEAQIIVRPHPGFFRSGYTQLDVIKAEFPSVIVQESQPNWTKDPFQDETAIREWTNTMRHSDVVINLTSTILVDAAICDRPVINLNFDPQPGQPNQQLILDINQRWNHASKVIQSGGVWLVNNYDEMLAAAAAYLHQPELHSQQRRWMVNYVAGQVDGCAGKRMAETVVDFLAHPGTTGSNHHEP